MPMNIPVPKDRLVSLLPQPLLRFFSRYPPSQPIPADKPHPFEFHINPISGNRNDPVYSRRRQADLINKARPFGLDGILKEMGALRDMGSAKPMKGLIKWKRHKSERTYKSRMQKRADALEGMAEKIKAWNPEKAEGKARRLAEKEANIKAATRE
ncbi:54S ribosomal protein L25, mitochondrial [Saitoella coloradoensis]